MKELIVSGSVKDVIEILNGIIERNGNITIKEYLKKRGKERIVLC